MAEKIECKNGSVNIDVQTKNFWPDKGCNHFNRQDLVFFTGWATDGNAPSYRELFQSLANNFGREVHVLKTKPEKIIDDSLFYQAKAAANYIKGMEMSDVVVAGYSEGAAKALNLTYLLQKTDSTVKPEALLLMSPVFLNPKKSSGLLVANFLSDGGLTIGKILAEKNENGSSRLKKTKESGRVMADIAMGIVKDAKEHKSKYPKVLANEIKEINQENLLSKEISVPVILFQGKYDGAAGPSEDFKNEELIEERLKRLFPNSPHIDRILLKQSGKHAGVLLRSKEVAELAFKLFKENSKLATQDIQVRNGITSVNRLVI